LTHPALYLIHVLYCKDDENLLDRRYILTELETGFEI
jgi:hypothetical protein